MRSARSWRKAKEARETIDFTGKWALLTDREREVFSDRRGLSQQRKPPIVSTCGTHREVSQGTSACRKLGVARLRKLRPCG